MKYPEGIGELTSLELLSFFPVGRGLNKLGYLKNLNQLGGSLYIHIKDNMDDVTDAKNADLKSKKHIQILTIYFHENVRVKEDVMEALEPPPNLQWLEIDYYGETRLPTWTTSLKNLRHLGLSDCFELMSLSPLRILPSLEKLRILGLSQLKSVGPAFLGIGESLPPPAIGFPMLTELLFEFCNDWEEWEDTSPEDENKAVPLMLRLRRLIIWRCRKLKALPHRLLRKASSLECIELDYKKHNPCTILYTNITIAEIKARPQNWPPSEMENAKLLMLWRHTVAQFEQAVIEVGLVAPLVNLLQTAEFDIKKEAAWTISNATFCATPEQIKFLVSKGCIKPLCDLLVCPNPRIVTVWLEGLENILKVGEIEKNIRNTGDVNYFAKLIGEAEGLEKIENLQYHNNNEIYEKVVKILETYWLEEEDETLPEENQAGFNFGGGEVKPPLSGFTFG